MQDKTLEINKVDGPEGATVFCLKGPLLLGNFFSFQSAVRADTSELLVIDLSEVPYIDSAGIGCLVGAQVSREHSNRKLVLVGASERLVGSLKVTRVDQLFRYASSVEQAPAVAAAG